MQLEAFARAKDRLDAEGIKVVAASVDTEEVVRKTVEEKKVNFPISYEVDSLEISRLTGAYYQKEPLPDRPPHFLHTTDFLLTPDGIVNIAVYSSGPLGRLVWQDVIQAVQFRKKKMVAAQK
ncbi:MAG: redoxin domain-containing protein [bacterium]|nr:redoxin domain-containing protein [bacterium]